MRTHTDTAEYRPRGPQGTRPPQDGGPRSTGTSAPPHRPRPALHPLLVVGLALLGTPRVVLHDLGLLTEGTGLNALFVFLPAAVWVATAVLLRVRRPFPALLLTGAVYGALLAAIHQILWTHAFAGAPPVLGGGLADLDPGLQNLVLRGFAVLSGLVTGTLVGAVCGLAATGLRTLLDRMPALRPGQEGHA